MPPLSLKQDHDTGTLSSFWFGEALGPIERACLRSAVKAGHGVDLYCYKEPRGVPSGVTLRDAEDVLPLAELTVHETGSVALFSDRFRYELQLLGRGVWIDTDVYFLRPLDCSVPYIYGYQSEGVINGAVLKLPVDSPLLSGLRKIFEEREVPFWLNPGAYEEALVRLQKTGRTHVSRMPWGSAGPNAITALAKQFGLERFSAPTDVFYPVYYKKASWICDPRLAVEDMVSNRTVAVHLWNELIKEFKEIPAPAGSFLSRLQDEGA